MDISKTTTTPETTNKKTPVNNTLMLISLTYAHTQDSLGNVITRTTLVILQQESNMYIYPFASYWTVLLNLSEFAFPACPILLSSQLICCLCVVMAIYAAYVCRLNFCLFLQSGDSESQSCGRQPCRCKCL